VNKAKAGAAIVTCSGAKWPLDDNEEFQKLIQDFRFDYTDRLNSHYISQLTESIHTNIHKYHTFDVPFCAV
jgi:hypothetical protein